MSPVRVTAARTMGRARNLLSTAFAFGGGLAVSSLFFSFRLEAAEGGAFPVSIVWASSVAFVLPALAALLGMDVWSEERLTGRIDGLLSLAVRERDYVFGKFLGVLGLTLIAILLHLAASVVLLRLFAPHALDGIGCGALLLALAGPCLQAVLWSALSVSLSALFRHPASAACATLVLAIALPRGVWAGLMSWSPDGRTAFGEFPLDAHIIDIASGMVPFGTVVAYLVVSALALFVASKFIAATRLSGRGALGLRVSTGATVALALVVAGLAVPLLQKVNPTVDIPVIGADVSFSQRTRGILTESSGAISISCFLPRSDARYRPIGRLLRSLQRESEALGGARITLRFVDPRWDLGAAERLVRRGVKEESLVFEKGRRTVALSLSDGCGERSCASAIRQISSPILRRNVYWTVGHGESAFDAYDTFGMSEIARELFGGGFQNRRIDLAASQQIPGDCALILIAGAKDDFSRVEIGRLDAYLREGGRLLVLQGQVSSGGVSSLLPAWGIRPVTARIKDALTLSGSDVIVSDFAEHPISAPLKGSRIVLDQPVAFAPSAVIGSGLGADSIEFRPVAKAASETVVAAVERGGGAGSDLALRPARIVTVGDAGFALNGALASRASANRDFFMNCVSYLAGLETYGAGDEATGAFRSGMDRRGRFRHAICSAVAFPLLVFLTMAVIAGRRRRRA